jgi:hypothetical protein
MLAHKNALPESFEHHEYLFELLEPKASHYDSLQDIYSTLLYRTDNDFVKAQVKYKTVLAAIDMFKESKSVDTPESITVMLQEAADQNVEGAREFVNSGEGKALMRRRGYGVKGTQKSKTKAQRDKLKKKRKASRKAKRA